MLKFNVFKYGMRCSMAVKWVALKSDCLGLKLDSGHVLTVTLVKTLNLSVPQFYHLSDQIRSDQSLSRVRLLTTPWIEACQASLSITNSRSSLTPIPIPPASPLLCQWSDLPAPNHSFYLRRFLQPSCLSLVEALYFIPPLRNMLRSQILLDTLELLTFWILKLSRFRQISLAFLAPFSPSSVVHPHLFVYSYLWFLNRCDWFLSVPFFFFSSLVLPSLSHCLF